MTCTTEVEGLASLRKLCAGRVMEARDLCITQQKLHLERLFGIWVTLTGVRLVLLETWELKEVKEYINASVGWVNEWFET